MLNWVNRIRGSFRWIIAGQCLLLALTMAGVSYQVKRVKEKIVEMADLKDPSPFKNLLAVEMSRVNVGLLSYLQSHDSAALDQITQAKSRFFQLLDDFQQQ